MTPQLETFFSVDVETSGPNPGQYSLLALGACTVFAPQETFYMELQPVGLMPTERHADGKSPSAQPVRYAFTAEALSISGLDMEKLKANGQPPQEGMRHFAEWVNKTAGHGSRAVFVALNAPFDWMFVNDYFHRYLGRNPFGHSALDIKALYMGLTGAAWQDTNLAAMAQRYQMDMELTHNALQDAIDQAKVFSQVLNEARARSVAIPIRRQTTKNE